MRWFVGVRRIRRLLVVVGLLLAGAAGTLVGSGPAAAGAVPSGFRDSTVLTGLTNPTVLQFASDGRIFVAQQNGVIKVFQSLSDTHPVTFADLSSDVDDFWDRGLLGMALAPNFPTDPYIYVLYTRDATIGGVAPLWHDACPTPPGPNTDGCVVSARVARLRAGGNVMTGAPQVLVEDWCQQFSSHSIGTLQFGRDGDLYVSGGDGASYTHVDYGQSGATYAGDAANPCGDPPAAAGTALAPPDAEGGALRSQSVRRADGPASLDGTILRVDPATGSGVPGNPYFSSPDPNARRIVAYGLRNPFRITQRPNTDELWIGDVGQSTWEEIDRLAAPASATAANFGWPCYEGAAAQSSYQAAGLNMCESLYATSGAVTAPYYSYNHNACVVSYPGCHSGSSSITGIAFYQGGSYPAKYNGALFFADHSRNEIWAMLPGTDGLPDPARLQSFVGVDSTGAAAGHPVDLKIGPGGDLFYVDLEDGTVHRVSYTAAGAFAPVGPARVLDTRSGLGAPKAAVPAHGTLAVQVTGIAGVPASAVSAVAVNLAVSAPTTSGYLTAYPNGKTRPTVSNLNFTKNQTIANLAIVPVGANGKITLYNGSSAPIQLIADIAGYYRDSPG